MKIEAVALTSIFLFISMPASAMNKELGELITQDFQDRQTNLSLLELERRDLSRGKAVIRMLEEGSIKDAIDYERAALIFQHGRSPRDFRLAHALATIALVIDPDRRSAKDITKVSWDRFMMSLGKQQWFGSQSFTDEKTGKNLISPIDPTITDEQRLAFE